MSQQIAGSIAFVTGANRGIGAALVDALITRGATKVYAAARSVSALEPLVARHGARIVPVQLDVTRDADIRAAAALAADTTLLINNAGLAAAAFRPLTEYATAEDLRREFEVNAIAPHAITQAFAPAFIARSGGTIVNLASVASFVNYPPIPTYSASKAATHSLTQGWRVTLAAHGVEVLGVYPGPVDTDMARGLPIDKTPASDVANAILDGVEHGTEDIFPDVVSQGMGAQYLASPKELERLVATPAVAA